MPRCVHILCQRLSDLITPLGHPFLLHTPPPFSFSAAGLSCQNSSASNISVADAAGGVVEVVISLVVGIEYRAILIVVVGDNFSAFCHTRSTDYRATIINVRLR